MKQTTKTSRTAGYLEKLFRALNRDFFPCEEVEEPIITLQSTPREYGHVSVAKIWERKGEATRELNISCDRLKRPIEHVAATMLHEMVHLYNLEHGIQDTSNRGVYHNKKFKEEAEKRGLIIDHDERYGWTITNPGDRLLEWVIENGWTEIDMERGIAGFGGSGTSTGGGQDGKGIPPKRPSSTRKYVCPCCKQSVRATKIVNIICGDCHETMITA